MALQIGDLFEAVATAVPEREALVCGGGDGSRHRLTYRRLGRRADAVAALLAERGIGPGATVGLHLRNHAEHVEAILAVALLRAVPVNANTRYTADELAYVLADAGVRVVLTEPDLLEVATDAVGRAGVDGVAVPVDEAWRGAVDERVAGGTTAPAVGERSADDRWLIYTGGTTGAPKGVVWRHEDLFLAALGGRGVPSRGVPAVRTAADAGRRALGDEPLRRRAPFCPLIHGGALWIVLQALLSGGTAILSTDRHLDPVAALDLLAGERVELTMVIGDAVAGPIVDALAAEPDRWDLSALQVVASGGAVLSPAVVERWHELVPQARVLDTFGASETGGQGRLVRGGATDGRPRLLTDDDTEVLDDEGRPVGVGEVGKLARSGNIPLGYRGDEARTAATFPVVDGRRWSVPGDLARREADGTITLLGRGATSINTGGEKVFPEEVESTLKAHPAVADALVVGVPHERFGEAVAAVVALRADLDGPGPSDDDLRAHCRATLAGYKVPRTIVRVDACQRLATGKPDYVWARGVAIPESGPPPA